MRADEGWMIKYKVEPGYTADEIKGKAEPMLWSWCRLPAAVVPRTRDPWAIWC